ncbi:HNH endonuclease [Prescottella agglutinans]|uniref:5-methylcytosine-specific restriction endonuclease McrA n=1 Tax=Prescottella agglutinans TaxID=1644129 RepID=A0ABT6MBZ0_9NOCA|nr:HNH endonuclease [Prescottella agglutinans]MDH6280914.1 5-methylcytosine-specific restriction endonuclease McrA [Prescottella agglutinans]
MPSRARTAITARTWMNSQVRVLNSTFDDFDVVPAARAVVLVVENVAVTVVERTPCFVVRSQHFAIPLPEVVRLVEYVHTPPRAVIDDDTRACFATVLQRDRHRCAYCGTIGARTVDHVQPRSRGGADTYGNLVAACASCNHGKADRTPEEAGMPLLWVPRAPRDDIKRQRRIWRDLAALPDHHVLEGRGSP